MTDDDSPWMRRPVSTAASTRLSFSPRLHFTPQSKAQAVSPNAMHPRRQNNPTITKKKKRRACISPLITLRGAGAAGRKPSDPDPKAKKWKWPSSRENAQPKLGFPTELSTGQCSSSCSSRVKLPSIYRSLLPFRFLPQTGCYCSGRAPSWEI